MSDNEKETQVAEETQNTQAAAEATNEDRKSRRGQRGEVVVASAATVVRNPTRASCSTAS